MSIDDEPGSVTAREDLEFTNYQTKAIFQATSVPRASMRLARRQLRAVGNECSSMYSAVDLYVAAKKRRKLYLKKRVPSPSARATRIVFGHDPKLKEALRTHILNIGENYRRSLPSDDGGRHWIVAALMVAGELLRRLPLDRTTKLCLIEPLAHLRDGLCQLSDGDVIPALVPAKHKDHRPKDSIAKVEFRVRCMMAVEALLAEDKISETEVYRKVYERSKSSAALLGIKGKITSGGFTEKTIAKWHEHHKGKWKKWLKSRDQIDEDESDAVDLEVIGRWTLEDLKRGCAIPAKKAASSHSSKRLDANEQRTLRDLAEFCLQALAPDTIYRPLSVLGPRSEVPF